MKYSANYIIILLALVFLLAAADDPVEYKLAVIEAGGYVPKEHITVARFRSLLKQLQAGYKENSERIANMTVWAQKSLREEGIKESLLNIMEGMNQILVRETKKEYAQFVAAYVVLRTKGMKHEESVKGMRDLFESLSKK